MRHWSTLPSDGALLRVRAEDGVRLRGFSAPALPGVTAGRPTFVLAHGFGNSVDAVPFRRLAGWLRAFGDVRAVDFREHGRSGGATTVGGDPEVRDIDAAVRAAREAVAGPVVTVGFSMGGGVALRHAALGGHRPDAVVSVSAVSRWYVRDTAPMRRSKDPAAPHHSQARGGSLQRGRAHVCHPVQAAPVRVAAAIAPVPLLLVHGDRDEYFPLEHFRSLAQAAGPAATVWVEPGMGHAENGVTAPLAARIGRWAVAVVADTSSRGVRPGAATSGTIAR
ncbi:MULTISPECIES: alpha/beta hydrolase [unclassified Modestobacter]